MEFRIARDDWGIPTISADDLDGLFRGQGYAVAEDRLWHLEWDRRRALGTMAELTGRPNDTAADAFARRARLGDAARAGFAALDHSTQRVLQAHADGINDFLGGEPNRPLELRSLGCEPALWECWHSIAIFLIRHVNFATWQAKLWRTRVFAALGVEGLQALSSASARGEVDVIVPSGVREAIAAVDLAGLLDVDGVTELEALGLGLSGSNCWAIDGTRSATGLPIIAGDPHRALECPNVYYQIRLSCTSEPIEAAGFCFVGVPGIQHFGQNGRVAWGVTNAMADYQDLFVERLPSALTDVRNETVNVAGGDDVVVECAVTRHGPIVIGDTAHGIGLSLASTGLHQPGGSLRLLLPLLRAGTVDELDAALANWVEPVNNWVMADSAGALAYRTGGAVPIRPAANNWLPVPGWTETFDWSGHIPHDELPQERNPTNGMIVTANQQVATADYPHRLGVDLAAPNRAHRIWARLQDGALQEGALLDVDGMAAIHGDDVTLAGAAFATASRHPALSTWDGAMSASSAPAAIYAEARHQLVRVITDRLPATLRSNPFAPWEPPATCYPPVMRVDDVLDQWIASDERLLLRPQESWQQLTFDAVDAALMTLAEQFGDERTGWSWGASHRLAPLHPLADRLGEAVRPQSGPISGADGTVMATNNVPGLSHLASSGSTARYVWDLADPTASGWVVPLGASGDPTSPNFADQTALYAAGRLIPAQPRDQE